MNIEYLLDDMESAAQFYGSKLGFQVVRNSDLEATISLLRNKAVKFRGERFESPAGKHILVEDPSGNLIEIVEFRGQQQVTH